jgi:hypothetical protein
MGEAMPTIDVTTTSSDFGTLPSDAAQFGSWIQQYEPSTVSIYQAENNDLTYMTNMVNGLDEYVNTYGYNSLSFIESNELQMVAGSYTVDYYGTFSSSGSLVTHESVYNSVNGNSGTITGNFQFTGYPVVSSLEAGSTLTGATALEPDPVTPGNNISAALLVNATWNGTYWSGYTTGESDAISQNSTGQMVQINYLNTNDAFSFQPSTPTTTGFLNFSVPQVDGMGLQVSSFTTGTITDSILVDGFSYSGDSVSVANGFAAAIAGNDVVSITGSGALNVIPALVADATTISSVALYDNSVNFEANLSSLESLANEGKLTSVYFTDATEPTISVLPDVAKADAAVFAAIASPYQLDVLPCFAAGTRIWTERGETMVQHLKVGERACLAKGGMAPIVWLGHRQIDCQHHPRPADVMPVRIAAHAFGLGRPSRDVLLSPDHAIFVDEMLIPVRYLLNDATVRQEHATTVTYWHVELPEHGVLLAEGLPAESYLDTGNRSAFANGGVVVEVQPNFARSVWKKFGCVPLITEGPMFNMAYRRLLVQALALGWTAESLGDGTVVWHGPNEALHRPFGSGPSSICAFG